MTDSLPTLNEVAAEAGANGLATSPSELHGALAGWLAGGGESDQAWLARVMADPELAGEAPGSALERLRMATASQLGASDFGFELLLADDGAGLAERSGSLFDWCRGFLGGFGLAAGASPPLSDEGSEALTDLAKFAAAVPQEEGDEEDEQALAEIEEFVRVAAILLYGDCVLGPAHRRKLN